MHQSLARYSAPVSLVHAPSWADFITTMVGFKVFGTHSRCWRAKWTFVVWDQRPAVVVHRHSLHVRHRFGAADPGPVIRRALLDIWAVKSSILERRSLRIGEVFALL